VIGVATVASGLIRNIQENKMAFITEEIEYENPWVKIVTVAKQKGEDIPAWKFISIELDGFERISPSELRDLGNLLVKEGTRIGKEYKSNGSMKENK